MKRLTEDQKTAIRGYRASGYGYKSIAEALCISRETVRSFCRRDEASRERGVYPSNPINPAIQPDRIHGDGTDQAGTMGGGKDIPLPIVPESFCKNCGKQIIQISRTKRRVFCTDRCRKDWWNAHPEEVQKKAIYTFSCGCCGKAFTAYGNAGRKYCSHECYIKARFGNPSDGGNGGDAGEVVA